MGERPTPDAPHPGKRPPPGALLLPQKRAQPARKSARCGVGDGSPSPHHCTHSQWVARPGRTPQGRAVGRGRAPNPGRPAPRRGRPPQAASCRPHSAQSQLARRRALGLVSGLHTDIPRTHSQWVLGPGRTPQGRAVERGRAPNPGLPTPRQRTPPLGALVPPPQRAKPALESAISGW